VYLTGVRNLLGLQRQQIPHYVPAGPGSSIRDDSVSSIAARCEGTPLP
jgi:hypothetical protein